VWGSLLGQRPSMLLVARALKRGGAPFIGGNEEEEMQRLFHFSGGGRRQPWGGVGPADGGSGAYSISVWGRKKKAG
jgi:hypothetical protein